ncbi:ABC transporter ATP-binding protein [Rubrobacter marinus]|uniref:ABC transporter ATP-binding protein n=1 Tax=Rubrobacter marinus TaxID=2653852 RepID=UPI001A9DE73C|nr:ABC transporter ATP-binding protein [Rubrobacter marinus]
MVDEHAREGLARRRGVRVREPARVGGGANADAASDLPVISTRGLSKSYRRVHALKPLDLTVSRGSIFGFLGPNGAGKTTAIKLLLGLTRPTSGTGTVFGRDIATEGVEIRSRIGYLAQEPRFYDFMTARETLRFTARFFYEGPEKVIERRIGESLELVGLEEKADRKVRGFSGGERQRLGLAQAQINDPELLILDEPAASLDPMGRRDVLSIMESFKERATIFYSTHILSDVQRVSDSLAILKDGKLLAQASTEELLSGRSGGTATYELLLKATSKEATEKLGELRSRVRGLPWVSSLEEEPDAGELRWIVRVTAEAAAEEDLLRLVLDHRGVRVVSFGRQRRSLEEAFFGLVEGGDVHGG